jgi:mRNA interferase MazF
MVTAVGSGRLYLADLGEAAGAEPGKIRPVVVVQSNFLNSRHHTTTIVVPCTTNLTPSNILRVRLVEKVAGNLKDCDVMIDQIRSIDTRRFLREIGTVPRSMMQEIRYKIACLLDNNSAG